MNLVSSSNFVINTKGEIEQINAKGDEKLNQAVQKALVQLNSKLNASNQAIIPAKDKNGKSVELAYNLPVRFAIQ